MKDLIEYISRSLVNDPTQVSVKEMRMGSSINYELQVAKEDMGRVIGRSGRVANAMRTLLRVSAAQRSKRANLEIVDTH